MFVTVAAAGCSALITPPMQASVHRTRAPSMLLPLIDSGKPGMNIRPYDKLLNFAAPYVVPLLVEKGSVLFKPLYKVGDKLRNRKKDSNFRSAYSNSYEPIVVFSSRTVKDVDEYKKVFADFATEAQASGSGTVSYTHLTLPTKA